MGFSGKCKWFPQGTKQEKLVDTNRMRLLELRMKKKLVNNNRRLCYC